MITGFQGIQTALFYKKIMFELFMPNLNMFSDQNRNSKAKKKNDYINVASGFLKDWLDVALKPTKDFDKIEFL